MTNDSQRLDEELARLRNNGLVLPRHPQRAMQSYGSAVGTDHSLRQAAGRDLHGLSSRLGRPITDANYNTSEVQKLMAENKAITNVMGQRRGLNMARTSGQRRSSQDDRWYHDMQRTSMIGGGGASPMGGDVYNAIPRFYDPLEYWDLSGLPWNVADEGHRHKLHKWLRLYYATHYLVPILVDIFTRFPLVGMELEHQDPQIKALYEDLFLDQLNYEDFLVSLGREFWVVGEAFPLGSFDEDLGIWEHEELINPEDVVIDNFPLLGTQQLKIVPPDYLRRIAQTKSPAREWYLLQQQFEDLIPYLLKGEHIPISPVMLRQVGNKMNDWDDHGTPILMRGLRTLLHEEKLMASQDAIAERLYSPFILAKLGIMDMGDGLPPWMPGPDELQSVRDDIDIAMASDFRVMVHHFGLEMESVFGREQMPRLGDDFDRIERRLMQVFGVNPSLLSAGTGSQPYASSALQAEFMNQILRTFQKMLKDHFKQRAMVVAEAQGHYEYERKGQTRVEVWETVVEYDEDGEKQLVKKRKLTVPDLNFATFDLRDEATERQFMMELRQQGVPIPDDKLMVGVTWKNKDYITEYNQDIKEKTIAQQRAKMDTYIALVIQGLPVPMDLKAEVESVLAGGTGPTGMPPGGTGGPSGPGGGGPPPGEDPSGGMSMPPPPPDLGAGPGSAPPGGGAPPTSPMEAGPPGNVPAVSNERRPGLNYGSSTKRKLHDIMAGDTDYGDVWVDRKKKKLYLNIGDAFGELVDEARDAAEREWPDYHIEIMDEGGQPKHTERVSSYEASWWTEDMRKRASEIYTELQEETAADKVKTSATVVESTENTDETDDPDTWVLKPNQTVEKQGAAFVIHEGRRKAPELPIEPSKRYSIIDPLAPELDEENSEPTESEPTG